MCFFHGDELGSTLALTDGSGQPISEFAYSPYGKILARTGTAKTPYLYIGGHGVYYEGLNLYNMKARFYDSYLTRFINKDPIGIEGGYNLYLYANANPLVYIDGLGWCAESSELGTRIGGGLQMIAGGIEAGLGYSFAFFTAETVVGAVAGVTVGLHGSDVAQAGARTMWYGEQQDSFTSVGFQEIVGLSRANANLLDSGISMAGTLGVGYASMASTTAKSSGNYLNQTWHKGTFPNKTQSVKYHLAKHGRGRSATKYTKDAMNFFNKNKQIGKNLLLKDGTSGIKINTKIKIPYEKIQRTGGYWTKDGKLVTYWD